MIIITSLNIETELMKEVFIN